MTLKSKKLFLARLCCNTMTAALLLSGALCSSCDNDTASDSDGDGNPNEHKPAEVHIDFEVPPCMATFTESYRVVDMWDDVVFTISKGDTYIIKELDDMFNEATVYYLTEEGPYELSIEQNAEGAYPFETDCTDENSQSYMGVFADTTIYADEELSTELCTVKLGKAVASSSYGFWLVGDLANGDSVYELTANAIVTECGADTGYIVSPEVEISPNQSAWLIPIETYLGKNE